MIYTGPITRGVDVSSVQGYRGRGAPPDFQRVAAAGFDFAIAKVIEGNADFPDPSFVDNWKGVEGAGMVRGAYPFLHPDTRHANDAADEAKRCVAKVGPLGVADFIMGDLEDRYTVEHGVADGEPFVLWLVTWGETAEAESGKTPAAYTGGPFWAQHAGKNVSPELLARVTRFPLVIAAYVDDPDRYVAMTPWAKVGWWMHQRSGDIGPGGAPGVRVPGIGSVVDIDVYHGSVAQLRSDVARLAVRGGPEPGLQLADTDRAPAHAIGVADRAEDEARSLMALMDVDSSEPDTIPETKPAKQRSGQMPAVRPPASTFDPDATQPGGEPPKGAA